MAEAREDPFFHYLGQFLSPMGAIWVNALRAAVIPLVVSYVVTAVTSIGETRRTGRLAGVCFLTFVGLVTFAVAYSVPAGYALAGAYTVDQKALNSLRGLASITEANVPAVAAEGLSFGESLTRIVPSNLFQAAVDEQILGLVLAALLFGLAITRLPGEGRELLRGFFRSIAGATMVMVIWILWIMPLGVFSLAFTTARQTGWDGVWAFGFWIVAAPAVILGFVALLYLVALAVGKVPVVQFARALGSAQIVALGSRSSLACIPALMDGAGNHLNAADSIRGFVIPLSSATFKLSGPLGSPLQLFLLAKLYGIPLDPATVGIFALGIMLIAFATPGIPSGGFTIRLPLFVAAGIPLEGFMLMTALDAIPDMFKTLVNVTGDMTVLTIASRFFPGGRGLDSLEVV